VARVDEESNTYRDLVGNHEKKSILGSLVSIIEDNIKV